MVFDYADYSKFTIEKIKQSTAYGFYSFETIDEIYDAIKDRYNEKYRFVKDGVKLLKIHHYLIVEDFQLIQFKNII